MVGNALSDRSFAPSLFRSPFRPKAGYVTVLTDLPAGHTFDPIRFVIDEAKWRAYVEATGDSLPLYAESGAVPPLAVAALSLGALLEVVSLPDGTLHGSESFRAFAPVPAGAAIECQARIAQRSARGGLIMTVLESDVILEGETLLTTRAMVMCPTEVQ
jgi:hypothetical protein